MSHRPASRDELLDQAMDLVRPAARAAGLSQDAYLLAVLEGRLPAPGPASEPKAQQAYLHRFSVKPRHLDAYLAVWPRVLDLWGRHGVTTRRVLLETQAEPRLTWLYECENLAAATASVWAEPESAELEELARPHVFRNTTVRAVDVERLAAAGPVEGRIAILRRYAITGSWDDFLAVWRQVVEVRERYGFRCLFAVADRPHDMFTWAFDFAGTWEEFPAAQQPYYHDPARVSLRGVFDYMADYTITPAQQLV